MQFMPDSFPPTHNDQDLWRWIEDPDTGVKQSQAGEGLPMLWQMKPFMGSEDFSFYSQAVPAAFIFLGQGSGVDTFDIADESSSPEFPTNVTLHSPRFNMDESVLDLGSALHTHLALRSLHFLGLSGRTEL